MTSDKDTDAFAKAMQGVKPLQQVERPLATKRPQAKAHNSRAARADLLDESLNGPAKGTPDMI